MKALAWMAAAAIQIFILRTNILNWLMPLAERIHNICLSAIQSSPSQWNWFFAAMLIGENTNLQQHAEIAALVTLGLYYLTVVSGIHIRAFEKIAKAITGFLPTKAQTAAITSILLFVLVANRFSPPCLRAMTVWIFGLLPLKFKIRSTLALQVLVTCLCLCVQPVWAKSLSFQLSCIATMSIAIARNFWPDENLTDKLLTGLLCLVSTAPLVFGIQPCLSWLVIPSAMAALPLFEGVLMPATLANTFIPWLTKVVTPIYNFAFSLFALAASHSQPQLCLDEKIMKGWGIAYVAAYYATCAVLLPLFHKKQFESEQNCNAMQPEKWSGTLEGELHG